ncbi:MAG: glycosyltransferase family 2 protein [Desulfovibrio sp.]
MKQSSPAESIRICAVVLHYGDPSLTRRVQRQLLERAPHDHSHVRILDNAAPLPAESPWVRLPENLYWAGALQWTLEYLTTREPEYTHLWFLNNDIAFATPGPQLMRVAQRLAWIESRLGRVGAYSPAALRNPYHPQMVLKSDQQMRTVAYLDGIAPVFNIQALNAAGGIDLEGNPYGYGVDVMTSLRLHQAGLSLVVDHQVALRHTYHSTARTVTGFMEQAARAEERYLTARLGRDYVETLGKLKLEFQDIDRL